MLITHCRIKTGDDCIVLRSINRVLKETKFCEQVIVENCTLETSCNAVRISYVRDGAICDATFRNLTIVNAKRGITCDKFFRHGCDDLPQTAVAFIFSHTRNASLENIVIEGGNLAQSTAIPLCDFVKSEVKSEGVKLRRLVNRTQPPDRCE